MKVNSALVTDLAICFIVFILLFVILGTLMNVGEDTYGGTITYTNIDTFEDDVVDTDPNGNSIAGDYNPFYDYDETSFTGTPGPNDDVNDSDSYDGSNSAWYAGNNSDANSQFYFLGEDGDELCGRTDISRIEWAINFEAGTGNEGTDVTLYDCDSGIIVWLTVTDTNAILYTTGPTELMNITIANMTWYRCDVEIDYSGSGSPSVATEFWSTDLAGFFTVLEDSNQTNIDCSKLWLMLVSPMRAGMDVDFYFDDLQFEFDVNTDVTTGLETLPVLWLIVIGVIVLCIVIGVLFLIITEAKKRK